MDMKKIFASVLICGALALSSVPAQADDGLVGDLVNDVGALANNVIYVVVN